MNPADLPALLGGPPIRPEGPPDWPPAADAVGQALQAAWRDGSWGKYQGGHVERLERRLAEMHGVAHAAVCSSGTLAVELALRALKVGPGDEVALAAYDYPGNFLAVHAVGARPVLIDVDAGRLEPRSHLPGGGARPGGAGGHRFAPARRAGPYAGVNGAGFRANIAVVEDAAQAPGAVVQGRRAGTWGDVGVLSFGGSKLLTAGRGGALLTGRADVYQRLRILMHRAGNVLYPLSELQAAVLAPQLDRLDEHNARRRRVVGLLAERLRDVPGLSLFRTRTDGESCYYKVGFRYDAERFGLTRAQFTAAVRAEGVALNEGFRALHVGRSPDRFRRVGPLAEAERAHAGAVVLHHPVLLGSDEEVEQVAEAVWKVHRHAARLAVP